MSDIDEILQAQLEAIESGQPVDMVLQALPNEAHDLEALIMLASAVRDLPHPEFEFEQAQAAKQKILAASQAVTRPLPRRRPVQSGSMRWMLTPRFAALAAVFLVALIAVSAAGVWLAGPPGGRSAVVMDVNGQVEAASIENQSEWRSIYSGDRVYANERIRTFGASEATLVFFEGSRATISANADVVLNTILGKWGSSLQVGITQNSGKTHHNVVPLQGNNSSYVVQSPGATASVQGTTFEVAVSDKGQSLIAVHTGKVQVSNDRNQVFINAGQATRAQSDLTLEVPAYTFSVAGQMTSLTADNWTVEGITFTINEHTSISGEPVVGDDLIVTGRIAANNVFIADRIEVALIPQPSATFTGEIQNQGEDAWQVSDQTVLVNAATNIARELQTGDPVLVTFTALKDGERLAQSIASLDEAAETLLTSAIPSPVPGAKPDLVFYPQEQYSDTCGAQYSFEGILANEGKDEKDFAANVRLHVLTERDTARYIETIEIVGPDWERIEAGTETLFTIYVTMKDGWNQASEKDRNVVLQVALEGETNRPNQHKSTMTIHITACQEEEPTVEPSPTTEPTKPALPTPSPRLAPDYCTGQQELDHPTGIRLAQKHEGTSYDEIMAWFCKGYKFGEIDLAYSLAIQNDVGVREIFEMKETGKPWGQVKKELIEKVKPTQKPRPSVEELKPTQKPKPEKDKILPAVVPTKKD
jgi:hypothetical protein